MIHRNQADQKPSPADSDKSAAATHSTNQNKINNIDLTSSQQINDQWSAFVESVGKNGNKSLLSLLRNSVILELTNEKLVIGYQNIQIFSTEKKKQVADVARTFFNPDIKVYYKEQDNGLTTSLKAQQDEAVIKKRNLIKESAANDPKVQKTLSLFPGSEIKQITILEDS